MNQYFREGQPVQIIQTTNGNCTFIDTEDFEAVSQFNWYISSSGYVVHGEGAEIALHRYVLGLLDFQETDKEAHHKNDNKLDNRKENLVVLTRADHRSTRAKRKDNTSGFKGVVRTPYDRWLAQIGTWPNKRYLGVFLCREDAARAYDKAAYEIYGDLARLNFPRQVQNTTSQQQ
jgi:hypothetical protein